MTARFAALLAALAILLLFSAPSESQIMRMNTTMRYNSYTGRYSVSGGGYNTMTGAHYGGYRSYNSYTGRYASGRGYYNPMSGRGYASRGSYNSYTGRAAYSSFRRW